ncbi:MAG: glycosyltransferase [Acidobacteria bacterium]|nr:glycosyltransferase [Acidobacteriota bacterium]
MTDTLDAGGAERVAVNLANLLPQEKYRSFLCVTRREGPLAELVSPAVGKICLARTRRLDLGGLRRLVRFIKAHQIEVLHAHSTALFVAVQAALFPPYPKVIWHDHFGRYAMEERAAWLHGPFVRQASGVIIVNRQLAAWVQQRLRVPAQAIWYVPNFVVENTSNDDIPPLPGQAGQRLVCVANLRPEKGHLTLIQALASVVQQAPAAHLTLVGAHSNQEHLAKINAEIARLGLQAHITLAGHQSNVAAFLRGSDIGVLSSYSEAFPLSLVEYGKAGLGVVATAVGECPAILEQGQAGLVVPPRDPAKLAEALLTLLAAPERRRALGETLRERVNRLYTADAVLEQIGRVYDRVLQPQVVAVRAAQSL